MYYVLPVYDIYHIFSYVKLLSVAKYSSTREWLKQEIAAFIQLLYLVRNIVIHSVQNLVKTKLAMTIYTHRHFGNTQPHTILYILYIIYYV